jgi:spore cortex formation protein SpoVR/YcgB (stage V sporulation)
MNYLKGLSMNKQANYLSQGAEWTFELLQSYDREIARIAEGYKLQTYPNQIEVINAEQMIDAYSSSGMPVGYAHWSFGKQFLQIEKNYKRGHMGLAYELVINSNPCICYLMEENTMAMQALVIAHAAYGHNSFFKNNYLFKNWTSADSIIDYLLFAKNYIDDCETRYGRSTVEEFLDSCHALMNQGVDRYKRPGKISLAEEKRRQSEREEYLQSQVNDLWRTIPKAQLLKEDVKQKRFPDEPQENLLYFFEKNAPLLEPWQREIIRIVRKISQYFYPQKQTKVMNEGWATFWHFTILNDLYAQGLIPEGYLLEILQSHTNVIFQPPFDSPYYSGINPYALGFALWQDIRRICEQPTPEDEKWFPSIVNTNWIDTVHFAMENFKDESFIAQYLSPKVIRDLRLFSVLDDDRKNELEISAIHDDKGYQHIRQQLSEQYNLSMIEPNIQVYNVNIRGDRQLILRHVQQNRRPLDQNTDEMLKHIYRLWGFPVKLESVSPEGVVIATYECL